MSGAVIRVLVAVVGAGLLGIAEDAAAHDDPPPAAESAQGAEAAITPPQPVDTAAAYPAGATGSARVELELTVAPDGSAQDVVVVAGQEPFATAAQRAAKAWRFAPARRGNQHVPARIRYVVRFVEEPAPQPDVAPTPSTSSATHEPAAQDTPVDVFVAGERAPAAGTSLHRTEVEQLPGAFGDPFRAIEALPGVAPLVSGVPYFYVRGAPPGNVGYFVDGIRVPQLFHAFVGPGVLHPALVERVDLYRGGYPARYGRFAGGVVAAQTRPLERKWQTEANVRLIDAGAMAEAPLPNRRGGVLIGGRYSYTSLVLSQLVPDLRFGYWDYQALASYDLSSNDTVGVLAFGALDFLEDESEDSPRRATRFHRLDLRYDRRLGDNSTARIAVTLGEDRLLDSGDAVRDRLLGGRFDVTHEVSKALELHFGSDLLTDRYDLTLGEDLWVKGDSDVQELFPSRDELVWGSYADVVWHADPRVTVTPGVRVDLFRSEGQSLVGVDPRVNARFDVTSKVRIEHAVGLAHQSAGYIPGVPAAQVLSLRGGLQRSVQASSGVEVDLANDLVGSATVYDNVFINLNDPLGVERELTLDTDLLVRSLGHAYGLELFVRRALTRKVGGYLSYTLSRSTRHQESTDSLSAFDRTHVLSLAAAFALGKRWRFGARTILMSGVPTQWTSSAGRRFVAPRAAPYYRIDWRLEKRWPLRDTGWWGFVAEVLNTTATRQITARSCNNRGECNSDAVGPIILPSLGVEGRL